MLNIQSTNHMSYLDYAPYVEEAFRLLGIDPTAARANYPGCWSFERGSIKMMVMLNETPTIEEDERSQTISFTCKIMDTPRRRKREFFQRLLELNHSFVNERFELFMGEVYLAACRFLKGLDPVEAASIMDDMSATADQVQQMLCKEFEDALGASKNRSGSGRKKQA